MRSQSRRSPSYSRSASRAPGWRRVRLAAVRPRRRRHRKRPHPIDLTGYWVSIVTQDWRQRMVTPPRGDYESVPITVEAKKVGDAWDPAQDEAAGEQCKSYGAPALMRVPGRAHITWQDDIDAQGGRGCGRADAAASALARRFPLAGPHLAGIFSRRVGDARVARSRNRVP